jgi:hypothetical protein
LPPARDGQESALPWEALPQVQTQEQTQEQTQVQLVSPLPEHHPDGEALDDGEQSS